MWTQCCALSVECLWKHYTLRCLGKKLRCTRTWIYLQFKRWNSSRISNFIDLNIQGVHIKSKECLKLFRKDVTTKKFLPKALKLFYTEEETENETSRVERNEALYYHWYDAG